MFREDSTARSGWAPSEPRPGHVLGERYELRRRRALGPLAADYEAYDQEREQLVLLRLLHTDAFGASQELRSTLQRLRQWVGRGGGSLAPLLDADREGKHLFVVQPLPEGSSFAALLERRLAQGRRLSPQELLPVAARLQEALSQLPTGVAHGEAFAGHMWVSGSGFVLSGGFVAAALPPGVLQRLCEMYQGPPLPVAPEVRLGRLIPPASDLFSIGAVLWEAYVGRSLPLRQTPPPPEDFVQEALVALLAPDPLHRPTSLRPLLDALARAGGESALVLTGPAGRKPPSSNGDHAPRWSSVQVRRVEGAAAEGTVELSVDQIEEVLPLQGAPRPEEQPGVQPARRRRPFDAMEATDEIEPEQVMEVAPARGSEASSPAVGAKGRGVHAAAGRSGEPTRERAGTLELRLEEVEILGGMVSSDTGGGVVSAAEHVPLPEGIPEVPRPHRDREPLPPPREPAPAAGRRAERTRLVRRSFRDWRRDPWVLAAAAFVALLIVAVSLIVVAWRRAEQQRLREQRLRERIEQLRRSTKPVPPRAP